LELPKIIESPDFQAKLKQRITDFTNSYKKIVPAFTAPTPADPIYHILVELTLVEVIGIEKVNKAAYAQLLKLSNDIEFIAKGKIRPSEGYEAFRERVRGMKDQVSPAGTPAMYKALTFLFGEATIGTDDQAVSASVLDAYVEPVNNEQVKGELLIHVFTNTSNQALKDAVLKALKDAFARDEVKPALDKVTFRSATDVPITINALISLSPGYTKEHRKIIEENFRERFASQVRLGWTPTTSWIVKELHQVGVRSVILKVPQTTINVQEYRYASISKLELTVEEAA
jgi:phage-related baseplate assembly protein